MNNDSEGCFICGTRAPSRLQEHHIVPRRHGGPDGSENIVTLCAGCHSAVERIYDKEFFSRMEVHGDDDSLSIPYLLSVVDDWTAAQGDVAEEYWTRDPPELYDEQTDERQSVVGQLGKGEAAGYVLGKWHALIEVYDHIQAHRERMIKEDMAGVGRGGEAERNAGE